MATSGTVATTVINTAKVIEHAVRRCGLPPSSITLETIETANQNLYLLLLALANRGLNLWCVETNYIGLKEGQMTYQMPVGTIDILTLLLSQPTQLSGTNSQVGVNYTTDLSSAQSAIRVGFKLNSIAASETVTVSYSDDDITYTLAETDVRTDWAADTWYWLSLDPIVTARYFRISTVAGIDVSEFYIASSLFDLEIIRFNRDDYANLANKQIQAAVSTNYYYERKLTPQVSLWPVPNDDHKHLTLIRHRQVQDIGTLSQQIELPQRWVEAIIWQLAERLAFELPNIDPGRIGLISAQAAKNLLDVETEETDGANMRFNVGIGAYTK